MHCCVLSLGEGDEGYALYRFHPRYEHRLHRDCLEVVEVMARDPVAVRELWRYLLSMDLVESVRADFLPEDHPLLLTLAEPGRLRLTLADGLWLRLIDVESALRARTYASSDALVLEIRDQICSWNDGCLRIDNRRGGTLVERTDAKADISLDVADLASVYLGAFSFIGSSECLPC